MINKDQATRFVTGFNDLCKYCPPMLFDAVGQSMVMQMILAVANGQMELVPKQPVQSIPDDQKAQMQ